MPGVPEPDFVLGERANGITLGKGEELMYVIVGFRTDTSKSVYYGKAKGLEEMAKKTVQAFEKRGAQFISIRYVKDDTN